MHAGVPRTYEDIEVRSPYEVLARDRPWKLHAAFSPRRIAYDPGVSRVTFNAARLSVALSPENSIFAARRFGSPGANEFVFHERRSTSL